MMIGALAPASEAFARYLAGQQAVADELRVKAMRSRTARLTQAGPVGQPLIGAALEVWL